MVTEYKYFPYITTMTVASTFDLTDIHQLLFLNRTPMTFDELTKQCTKQNNGFVIADVWKLV